MPLCTCFIRHHCSMPQAFNPQPTPLWCHEQCPPVDRSIRAQLLSVRTCLINAVSDNSFGVETAPKQAVGLLISSFCISDLLFKDLHWRALSIWRCYRCGRRHNKRCDCLEIEKVKPSKNFETIKPNCFQLQEKIFIKLKWILK